MDQKAWNPASCALPDPRFCLDSFSDVLQQVLASRTSQRLFGLKLKRPIFCRYTDLQYQQLFDVWNTDFNSFSMPSNLHIKTSFQVTPFSPSPRHPSRGSLLLFRRSKMAGATATFSRGICQGKRALERQESGTTVCRQTPALQSQAPRINWI